MNIYPLYPPSNVARLFKVPEWLIVAIKEYLPRILKDIGHKDLQQKVYLNFLDQGKKMKEKKIQTQQTGNDYILMDLRVC